MSLGGRPLTGLWASLTKGFARCLAGMRLAVPARPVTSTKVNLVREDGDSPVRSCASITPAKCAPKRSTKGRRPRPASADARDALLAAASEEHDHLGWCRERLEELEDRPSVLNPAFYAASFALGAAAGLLGNRISLGFVEATEDEVCRHLDRHLERLPEEDRKSRAILSAMREDESRHGNDALRGGGMAFPTPIKRLMRLASRAMTESAYRI